MMHLLWGVTRTRHLALFVCTARDVWKKKYFEEKKKTPPLEEQTNKMRQELDLLHRRIMSQLEGTPIDGKTPRQKGDPSQSVSCELLWLRWVCVVSFDVRNADRLTVAAFGMKAGLL